MNRRTDSLLFKFGVIFAIFTVITLVMSGITTYVNQMNSYQRECETRIRQIADYLKMLMAADGEEFVRYQEYFLEHSDELEIPLDYGAEDYEAAKARFDALYSAEFPGKDPSADVQFDDWSDELKRAYTLYQHEYWLLTFEEARESFGVIYTYYVVPTEGDHNMIYMIDATRDEKEGAPELMNLGLVVYEPLEEHLTMWEAWETGKEPNGYDYYDNELGNTYAYNSPLIINGEKMGVVCVDIEVAAVNEMIVRNTLRQVLWLGIVLVVSVLLLLLYIYHRYISKLERLQSNIHSYAMEKDSAVAVEIEQDTVGRDEISSLSMQIAAMIFELENYMKSLVATTNELSTTKELANQMNELANKDALTGIRNRLAYDNEAKRLSWSISDEEKEAQFGIAIIDLNFLKRINDTYGHEQGNLAIKNLCRLTCRIFAHSPVFRIGGDEFAVILERDDYANVDSLIGEFNHVIDENAAKKDEAPWEAISAAIGYARFNKDIDTTVENVFKRADKAMYARKKAMKAVREK